MRFVVGPIPESGTLDAEKEAWTPLRQVNTRKYTAIAFVMAAPILVGAFWYLFNVRSVLRSSPAIIALLGLFLLLMLPLHELIHAMTFQGWLRDSRVMLGIWLPFGMWVCYDGPQPRNRLLLMSCMPLFTLSLLPLLILFCVPTSAWSHLFRFLAILHTATCAGDLQTFIRVMRQVPANAVIRNKGWQTYWRAL